jgi:hypothetical protein
MAQGRLFAAIAMILAGAAFGGFGWYAYQNEQADIENAVEVEGVVQGTSIDEDVDRRDRDDDGIRERETSYQPIVRYDYTYEGQSYSSDSVYPGPEETFDNRGGATDVTDDYSTGETVTVYVNSDDPSRAFLIEKSSTLLYYGLMGLGGLLAILGVRAVFVSPDEE